jgi:seryl-tRNA synthetase
MLDGVEPPAGASHRDRGQTVLSGDLLDLDTRLDEIFTGWARCWKAAEYRFPACVEARYLERLDYFQSFPHLATFPVTLDTEHGNVEEFARGQACDPQGAVELPTLSPTRHVLTPAACYHVYIELEGQALDAPRYITTRATCFRNEDEYTPLERQWNFSMREIVCLGSAAEVEDFLTSSTYVINHFAAGIGLPVEWADATDPFFSPANNPKYLFQKLEPVKRELIYQDDLAIASTNFHRDYFGEAFHITRNGETAYSGCVAFGMERWLSAFLGAYGATREEWSCLEEFTP